MFKNFTLQTAAVYSAAIILCCLAAAIIARIWTNRNCKKVTENPEPKIRGRIFAGKAVALTLFSVTGLFLGNLINIGLAFSTAISHGMTPNAETNSYTLTYGEIQTLNKKSVKETNIDISELKDRAVIFVRYDCPDCTALHDQLTEIHDAIFLSSRSERGRAAQETYGIQLTEIPQGVYIDANGKSTTIGITQIVNNEITLDLHQLSVLREMANRHVLL